MARFRDIVAAGVNILAGDRVIGLTSSGTVDAYWTAAQMAAGLPNLCPRSDKGTVSTGTVTFDISVTPKWRLQVGGALTIAITGWPASGTDGMLDLKLVNGGAFAITWPTVSWAVGDGTYSATFTDQGVTLLTSGTNFVNFWGDTGGTTVYGRAL